MGSTNTWDSSSHTCSDSSLTTEAACIAPGTCDDAGNTGPADAAACAQLFSDSGSCSDSSLATEAACIAPGSCDDAGNTGPADAAACALLFSDSGSCTPPSCALSLGLDCSIDGDGNDTGCIYIAPVPASNVAAMAGSCSDVSATYNAPVEAMCSDSSLTTELACISVGTCNDIGATNPADEAACIALFADESSSIAAVWTSTNTWTAAVVESCTECTDYDLSPKASSASSVAVAVVTLAAVVAQNL